MNLHPIDLQKLECTNILAIFLLLPTVLEDFKFFLRSYLISIRVVRSREKLSSDKIWITLSGTQL